jgi:hypothetical protein
MRRSWRFRIDGFRRLLCGDAKQRMGVVSGLADAARFCLHQSGMAARLVGRCLSHAGSRLSSFTCRLVCRSQSGTSLPPSQQLPALGSEVEAAGEGLEAPGPGGRQAAAADARRAESVAAGEQRLWAPLGGPRAVSARPGDLPPPAVKWARRAGSTVTCCRLERSPGTSGVADPRRGLERPPRRTRRPAESGQSGRRHWPALQARPSGTRRCR